jgi:hypothetical protein
MKPLPKRLGEEKFLTLNYANARFMKNKDAYRTGYSSKGERTKGVYFTMKVVEGDEFKKNPEKAELVQIHLRCPAKDRISGKEELLDVDMYCFFEEFKELTKQMIEEQRGE